MEQIGPFFLFVQHLRLQGSIPMQFTRIVVHTGVGVMRNPGLELSYRTIHIQGLMYQSAVVPATIFFK